MKCLINHRLIEIVPDISLITYQNTAAMDPYAQPFVSAMDPSAQPWAPAAMRPPESQPEILIVTLNTRMRHWHVFQGLLEALSRRNAHWVILDRVPPSEQYEHLTPKAVIIAGAGIQDKSYARFLKWLERHVLSGGRLMICLDGADRMQDPHTQWLMYMTFGVWWEPAYCRDIMDVRLVPDAVVLNGVYWHDLPAEYHAHVRCVKIEQPHEALYVPVGPLRTDSNAQSVEMATPMASLSGVAIPAPQFGEMQAAEANQGAGAQAIYGEDETHPSVATIAAIAARRMKCHRCGGNTGGWVIYCGNTSLQEMTFVDPHLRQQAMEQTSEIIATLCTLPMVPAEAGLPFIR